MDVPFSSSGATSRQHYVIVRKVENASSSHLADQYLLAEVKSIQHELENPTLSLRQCKDFLVILQYCYTSISAGLLKHDALSFALPHAVTLAEAGRTIQEKRTGYVFCAELMPATHELQLMLVNTLRKDLESSSIPRICLALDIMITFSTEDVIPAVQARLHDLLSHSFSPIRRRALLAFRALSQHDPEILKSIDRDIHKRMKDSQVEVKGTALLVASSLFEISEMARDDLKAAVNALLQKAWANQHKRPNIWILIRMLSTLHTVGIALDNFSIITEIIRFSAKFQHHSLLLSAFPLLAQLPSSPPTDSSTTLPPSPVLYIRDLLTSQDPNDHYIFLSCLGCIDPIYWAGTTPEIPPVLEAWEVERVMQLLESSDALIRRKTLKILNQIESNIVTSYYQQTLQNVPPDLSLRDRGECAYRLLEFIDILSEDDGELYSRHMIEMFRALQPEPTKTSHSVLDVAVEEVLLHIRRATSTFQIGCATTLLAYTTDLEAHIGPTLMVIISALACEYSKEVAIPPRDLLLGLSSRLTSCPLAVQDACLLAMLRVSAECEVPQEVLTAVSELQQHSGRHIRRRCDQFVTLSSQKEVLRRVIQNARTSALPDFLEALQAQNSERLQTTSPSSSNNAMPESPSKMSTSLPGKLRYKAYEPPPPVPRLRGRRPSSTSSHSTPQQDHDLTLSRVSSRMSETSDGKRIATAGDLALAAAAQEFELMSLSPARPVAPQLSREDSNPRADLIAFDSPFISDPLADDPPADTEADFESVWSALEDSSGARGWYDDSIDGVVRRLQSLDDVRMKVIGVDRPPFEGDLKVLISPVGEHTDVRRNHAALRLRESEDESCLWRLRCGDAELHTRVKRLLKDE